MDVIREAIKIDTHLNRHIRREIRAHQRARKTNSKKFRELYRKLKTSSLARDKYLQEVVRTRRDSGLHISNTKKQDFSGVSPLKGTDGQHYFTLVETLSKAES